MLYSKNFLKFCLKILILISAASLLYMGISYAAPKAEKVVSRKKNGVEKINPRTVSGTVSYVDNKYVSIVLSRNNTEKSEEEIGFWIDESEQEGWKKKLSELNPGDKIQINFDEVQQDYDEVKESGAIASKTKLEKRKAKSIKFLSPASTNLKSN